MGGRASDEGAVRDPGNSRNVARAVGELDGDLEAVVLHLLELVCKVDEPPHAAEAPQPFHLASRLSLPQNWLDLLRPRVGRLDLGTCGVLIFSINAFCSDVWLFFKNPFTTPAKARGHRASLMI